MDDLKIATLLNQQKLDIDYRKYENIKLAVQKRKSVGESNKSGGQKVLVTPLRAFCPLNGQSTPAKSPLERQILSDRKSVCSDSRREALVSRRCKSETKELRQENHIYNHSTPVSDLNADNVKGSLKSDRDVKVKRIIRKQSPVLFRDVNSSEKKTSDVNDSGKKFSDSRKSDSPLIISKNGLRGTSSPIPLERNMIKARCPSPSLEAKKGEKGKRAPSPKLAQEKKVTKVKNEAKENGIANDSINSMDRHLREVRRCLNFENDDDNVKNTDTQNNGLDFTDKIAALRSLISRDRIEKTITDRKAYYNEYHTSRRKVMVSRIDSQKDKLGLDTDTDISEHNRLKGKTKVKKGLKSQSADIFKGPNERLNPMELEMDLQTVKERLEGKQSTKEQDEHSDEMKENWKSSGDIDDIEPDDMIHATNGRKVLSSSRKYKTDQNEFPERPSSRLESKETQTNLLNQSIRSVQSNVPFFEPQGKPGRPSSAPNFNCEIQVGQRKVYKCHERDRVLLGSVKGAKGVKVAGQRSRSQKEDDRQSNVGEYVGTSLTPESKKNRHRIENMGRKGDFDDDEDGITEKVKYVNKKIENEKLKNDAGNYRPSSRCSQMDYDDEEVQQIYSSSSKVRKNSRQRSNSALNEDIMRDPYIEHCTNKSERKVREWIKKQEVLTKNRSKSANFNSRRLMEELNVSISIPTVDVDNQHSPSNSCDRIPVKLEKQKNEKPYSLGTPGATGFLESKNRSLDYVSNRQAIFDRLERISMAVTTQQQQFEVEIPVKDLKTKIMRDSEKPLRQGTPQQRQGTPQRQMQGEQSDSGDTEAMNKLRKPRSSVFSIPFSIESGESISSTCQAVKLLRRLYNVDTQTRQNLVLMAKCFRRWFNNVLHARARNQQILAAAGRLSPISYGVMLRKSDICYRDSLLGEYFDRWRLAYKASIVQTRVEALQRRHLLQKGMNAFRWAINRSNLQQGILQDRINTILIDSSFSKWKQRTLENRNLRLRHAFLRWRQYTKEAQKIRMLRTQTNKKLKERVFVEWFQGFQTRQNQHKADRHHRCVVLSQGWLSWRFYTAMSKEKKCRNAMAVELFQMTLQRKMFLYMKVEFIKYSKAKAFHRCRQLRIAITAWRVGCDVSRSERENDFRVAIAYWSHSTLRSHFTAWRDALLTNKACRLYNHNLSRNALSLWSRRFHYIVERREFVDSYRREKLLSRAFHHWCRFVVMMKRRRAAAVECIEGVLQKYMFQVWRWYTNHQINLRKRMLLHVRKNSLDKQRRCLMLWRSKFVVKSDEKRAQQLWSNSCAKKAAEVWRLVCHKRRLARLLIDSEPDRHLHTVRVYFMKWRSRFSVITEEKHEAADVRSTLDLSQLRQRFHTWHTQTQQLLLIKPMVVRYRHRLVTQCFNGWHEYVIHKAECLNSERQVIQLRLKNKFAAWRRQYEVHQVEKTIRKKCEMSQSERCLQAWRSVIQRKHAVSNFYASHLVRRMFKHWSTRARRQIHTKQLQEMEQELVMSTLREYFDRWHEQVYAQQTRETEAVTSVQSNQDNSRLRTAFLFWRRHFRATLVARENEKIRIRKLAKQALRAWQKHSQKSLQEAVERFAAAIGLDVGAGDTFNEDQDIVLEDRGEDLEASMGQGDVFEPFNYDLPLSPRSVTPKTPRTPRTPITPMTPKQSSLLGTPIRKRQSPALSRHSLQQSLDFECGSIVSSSFLDARFEMEQAVKTESRREIVTTVVHRLQHWPISIMFDQWKDYTARQRQFKHLTTQMISITQKLAQRQCFNNWIHYHREMKHAKQHYEQVLQHKALLSLILYRNERKQKKHLNDIAESHYARKVYVHVFPCWLTQAQEHQHSKKILHLWENITDEERELIPRERQFRYKLGRKTLVECFKLWHDQYRRIAKLKHVYHQILLERYFEAWCSWALERHGRRVKYQQYTDNRITKLAFSIWMLRYKQRTEVEQRYKDTWHNYLGIIVQAWKQWAKAQRQRSLVAVHIVSVRNKHTLSKLFTRWRQSHQKHASVKQWQERQLLARVLHGWQNVAQWQKDLKQRQLQCQLMSYTVLAKRIFRLWYENYLHRQELHRQHEHAVNQRVLNIGQEWRRRAQVTRATVARKHFQQQQMGRLFAKWKAAYDHNLSQYDQLNVYLAGKNQELLGRCIDQWRGELMCLQAERVFNMKLLTTLLAEWKLAAKGCRERRTSLQVYQSRKDNHTMKAYFLYWHGVAKARRSIRGHANLKIQLSVFKAWLLYTRKQINLRRLEVAFTKRRHRHILKNYWYMVKTRYEYCAELTEMAEMIVQEKNTKLMRQALQHWDFRLKMVIADECRVHLLAKRVVRTWRRFVCQRRAEKQRMIQLTYKALQFYRKTLCNKVYRSWYNEVLATRHAEKRRQRLCRKFALVWKHKVDMAFTARCMYEEKLYMLVWKRWHLEFVQRKTIYKVEAFERKQQLTMVFVSWKNLSRKRHRKMSMIPLPVSPACNMPSGGSSSSLGSMDDLESPSPVFTARTTQIPIPSSYVGQGQSQGQSGGQQFHNGYVGQGQSNGSYLGQGHSSGGQGYANFTNQQVSAEQRLKSRLPSLSAKPPATTPPAIIREKFYPATYRKDL